MKRFAVLRLSVAALAVASTSAVHAADFKDVPASHRDYDAIMFLQQAGIVQGYADGTFKPDQKVTRDAAVKMILAGKITDADLQNAKAPAFTDLPSDAWSRPYVGVAHARGIIDGPPAKTTFRPTAPVQQAEFLKMFFLAQGMDPGAYGEITLPLAADVASSSEWYYPYVRLALSMSMITVNTSGQFEPAKELTRADVAREIYYGLMYKAGRRTQALLSLVETEDVNTVEFLSNNDVTNAQYASARALIAARGALTARPDTPVVQGALKLTEAFRKIVVAYEAGVRKDYALTISASGEAWNLAETAKSFSADLAAIAGNVQQIAQDLANEARGQQGQ